MSGPMLDVDQVTAAIAVVDDATAQLQALSAQILAQSDAATSAITAPAGQITAAAFADLGGGGKALAEEVDALRTDLATVMTLAQSGSDDAAAAASAGYAG